MILFILIVSAVVVLGRFTVPGQGLSWPDTYEALAHIWVGVLFTLCFIRPLTRYAYLDMLYRTCTMWTAIITLFAISMFELAMFLIHQHG